MFVDTAQQVFWEKFQTAFASQPFSFSQEFELDSLVFSVQSNSASGLDLLTKALQHLAVEKKYPGKTQLDIEIWFTGKNPQVSTFIEWISQQYGTQSVRVQNDHFAFFYNPLQDGGFSSFYFLDFQQGRAIFWANDEKTIPWYELAAPFKVIFNWFFPTQKYYLLHAAAVADSQGAVLLVGRGGVGKSTTALTTFEVPSLFYLGDDYTLVKLAPKPIVFCLYSSAKVAQPTLQRFSKLRKSVFQVSPADQAKKTLFFSGSKLNQLAKSKPIVAVVLPTITGSGMTLWEPVSKSASLLALAPSTIFQSFPYDTRHISFGELSMLIQKLPTFRLLLGTDPEEIGLSLQHLLEAV